LFNSKLAFPFSPPLERRSLTIILRLAALAKATQWLIPPTGGAPADASVHAIC